ncbi:5'-3' exoribonuclease 3-like isoform X2 [Aristolochia californica]|uniref:5'-3' exoribonuclease 3-like isoform X2 n=1 Tax=Aristolochia californica TaxID=171875 RepID=UPI0035D6621C
MGIPAFYRWLSEKYPLTVVEVLEEVPIVVNGQTIPIDTSRPNPNEIEFDNLYLDMNNIIHPCFHPEDQPAPKNYEEVFVAMFKYIDRIFSIIRPRKLLYMAIDGVAPRAKMNQQRARRFRAAKDAADAVAEAAKLRSELQKVGDVLVHPEQAKVLDSNVITPGTEFMAAASLALQYYIHMRLNNDPGWRSIKVILSDANVPGEGEHKIMSYLRLQRNLPGFDPNTKHCLYGLDADLIMLALATHEVHFTILREDIWTLRKSEKNHNARQEGQDIKGEELTVDDSMRLKFQFLHIWVLRDYLKRDLKISDSSVKADLERLIDDFVFMCLFVGNDFLPHMPSLEISEGAIDLLMAVYKKEFNRMGGYLTNSFEVDLERVEHFIQAVGSHENAIFRRRSQIQKERDIRDKEISNIKRGRSGGASVKALENFWSCLNKLETPNSPIPRKLDINNGSSNEFTDVALSATGSSNPMVDKIRLGEEGWKGRYYAEKFEVESEDDLKRVRKNAVLKYTEGICWVMHYYYEGVCSWQWFYPYHYAPFASDFFGLESLEICFTLGFPFKPFDQLMGVLPAASAHALPSFYRKLMTDSSSPIADFYPSDFQLDMNGKRYSWQAVCKLPFIKESRLLAEIAKVEHTLMDEEQQRNSLGLDVLFLHVAHPLAAKALSSYRRHKDHPKLCEAKVKRKIDPKISGGMNGYMYIHNKTACSAEICSPVEGMEDISKNQTVSVLYKCPSIHPHIPRPPKGVCMPGKSISKKDVLPMPVLWHEKTAVLGRIFSERPVPNSISGPCLAKLAHQLVSEHYLEKKKGNTESTCTPNAMLCDEEETSCKGKKNDENLCARAEQRKRKRSGEKKKRSAGYTSIPKNLLTDSEKTSSMEKINDESLCASSEPSKRKKSGETEKGSTESICSPNGLLCYSEKTSYKAKTKDETLIATNERRKRKRGGLKKRRDKNNLSS